MRKALAIIFISTLLLTACKANSTVLTIDQIITAFADAGLDAKDPKTMTVDDYGLAPFVGSGVRFLIPSLCENCGGRVFVFDNDKDLESVKTYYEEIGKSSAIFFSWIFVNNNALVQINGDLPEEQARKYESVLMSLE